MSVATLHTEQSKRVSAIRDTSSQDRPVDTKPQEAKRRYRLYAIGAAVLIVLIAATFLIRSWMSAEVSVPLERVRIAEVTRGPFVRDVSAQGTVVAAVSPTLYAPATGTVGFKVQAGDVVKKGQIIANVDSPELRNELKREEATLASSEVALSRQSIETRRQLLTNQQAIDLADVTLTAAKRELARSEDSFKKGLISERDLEEARDDQSAAQVNHKHSIETALLQKESLNFELSARKLERDRQALVVEDLRRRVGDLEVKSPVDGIVGTLAIAERTSVAQNAAMLTVIDLTAFEIEFQVPESYADDLGIGMDAEVTYGTRKYAANVTAVSPEVRQGQVTGRLRFSGETPKGLRQNQRVASRIVLEARDSAVKVARGPFLDAGGGRVAYVVSGDVATRTQIQTGATSVSEVEIASGLQPGDRIIISNISEFESAVTVRLAQ